MSGKTLTKADIVDSIYEKTEKNRAEVKVLVDNLLDIMKQAIKKDHAMLVSGFGKFEAYDKNSRRGRNPQTSEQITITPRRVLTFKPSLVFRQALNRAHGHE